MAKKTKIKGREIRIMNPSDDIFDAVVRLSEEEKRSIGKQAEYMISKYLKSLKKVKK